MIDLNAQFLRGLISSETTIALRSDDGFIICQRRRDEGFVDAHAVQQPSSWNMDGAVLLLPWQSGFASWATRLWCGW